MSQSGIIPFFRRARPACPFYGFEYFPKLKQFLPAFQDKGCALNKNKGCIMKRLGKKICWDECLFNNTKNGKRIRAFFVVSRIFPEEFEPGKSRGWEGINFQDWFKYVLGKGTPRPED